MRRLLLLASAVVFVDTAFYAAITPVLPRYAEDFGLSKTAVGVLSAAYPAGKLLASLPGGWLAAKLGARRTTLIGLGITAVSSVAFGFAPTIELLDGARFVQGVGGALAWAGAIGWLVGEAPPERRGEMIGSALGAAIVGALFGPVVGAAAGAFGPEITFSLIGVAELGLLASATVMPARAPAPLPTWGQLAVAARDRRVVTGMWLMMVPGLMLATVSVLGPLRLDELGAGTLAIAVCFIVAAALEATVSPIIGRVSDRRGRRASALPGLAAGVVVMALLPWPSSGWLLGALVMLSGPVIGLLLAPAVAMIADGADAHGVEQALAFALVGLGWALGETVGSAGSARLAEAGGDHVPYLLLAAICAGTLAVFARPRARMPSA